MGTAAQTLIKRGAVALFFAAVQLTNENIVRPKYFIFAVSAKPVLKQNRILSQAEMSTRLV